MTNPDTRRPIEARLERALANTAIRNVPDGQAVPSYPDQPSRIDRKAPWIAPLLAAAAVVAVVCGSILAARRPRRGRRPGRRRRPMRLRLRRRARRRPRL